MVTTVGHFLLNDTMPEGYKISGSLTNKQLHNHLVGMARKDPTLYVDTIRDLKKRGDEIATLEGVSVGLDDITPEYKGRDIIVNAAAKQIAGTKDPAARQKIVVDAQTKMLAHTSEHPGSMTHMALSGARGSIAQLMKIVGSPLAANDIKKGINPFLIHHSYAEGLTPAEYWVTAPEARANNIATVISVAQPGEMNKVLIANMINKVVSVHDCGTHTGIHLSIEDQNVLDRYTADDQHGTPRNTLLTPQVVQTLKSNGVKDVYVRSPMTCAATHGTCQLCMGSNEKGHLHSIGTNVGVRSAQAMVEPLTQMALSSKHAVLTIKERKLEPAGFKGVRQLLEVPAVFQHEALLAPVQGAVGEITKAPQGGHFVSMKGEKLYAAPELTVIVKSGQHVEAGDPLTNGIPHPAKLVQHKGIGAARQFFVDALDKVYKGEGVNIDRRHFELLAKTSMNTVRLLDHDPKHPELLKGDLIQYNRFRDTYAQDSTAKLLEEAIGGTLGEELFHHTVGTPITPSLAKELKARGVVTVHVAKGMPKVEFIMRSFAMTPLMESDWMGRMSHRYLRGSLLQAAQTGETADIHGYHPTTAYAYGAEFKHGPAGTY